MADDVDDQWDHLEVDDEIDVNDEKIWGWIVTPPAAPGFRSSASRPS